MNPDNPTLKLFLAGAAKSGTTSLLTYLSQHPRIATHAHREMTHFARSEEFEQGFDSALDRYFDPTGSDRTVLVGKHAMAMYSLETLERLRAHSDDLHLALVLRNPVDRAYSHYWYARTKGWEIESSFERAIERVTTPPTDRPRIARDRLYITDGEYAAHVRQVLDIFDRGHTHIVLSSDLRDASSTIVDDLLAAIGLDTATTIDVAQRHNEARVARSELLARVTLAMQAEGSYLRKAARTVLPSSTMHKLRYRLHALNEKPGTIPPMPTETRAQLLEYYRPHNDELAALIARDLSEWSA